MTRARTIELLGRLLGGLLALLAARGAAAAPPDASPLKSRLTTLSLKACTQIRTHKDGGAWHCPGLPGYPVYVAERHLRVTMSFGADAETRKAAQQTLTAQSTIFDGQDRATIEWRVQRKGGRDVPHAAIVRYHTSNDAAKGDVLVVSKVDDKQACHLAYVDAIANADAMALARAFADGEARKRDCSGAPSALGLTGRSPM